jgi:para-nitrobenzyl esterase
MSGHPALTTVRKGGPFYLIHGGGYAAGSSRNYPLMMVKASAKKGDGCCFHQSPAEYTWLLDLSAYGEKYKHSANASILISKQPLNG